MCTGRWTSSGNTIDFYLSSTRNTRAAKRFLGKALKDWELPEVLKTDKAPSDAGAIAELKAEGKCPNETRHRQVKYLNNVVEADHGKLKLLIRPVRGFKTLKTAYATVKGFEIMRALRKGQAGLFAIEGGIVGEAKLVERAFDQTAALQTRRQVLRRIVLPVLPYPQPLVQSPHRRRLDAFLPPRGLRGGSGPGSDTIREGQPLQRDQQAAARDGGRFDGPSHGCGSPHPARATVRRRRLQTVTNENRASCAAVARPPARFMARGS